MGGITVGEGVLEMWSASVYKPRSPSRSAAMALAAAKCGRCVGGCEEGEGVCAIQMRMSQNWRSWKSVVRRKIPRKHVTAFETSGSRDVTSVECHEHRAAAGATKRRTTRNFDLPLALRCVVSGTTEPVTAVLVPVHMIPWVQSRSLS